MWGESLTDFQIQPGRNGLAVSFSKHITRRQLASILITTFSFWIQFDQTILINFINLVN